MRAFQVVCLAVAAATSYGGLSYGTGYGIGTGTYGASYGTGYYSAPSYGSSYSSGYGYGLAAPSYGASYGTGYSVAAPAYSVAAPAYSVGRAYSTGYAAPVAHVAHAAPVVAHAAQVGVIAAAPAAALKSHEIHTASGRQAIRIEDFQAGDQVVRVHEAAQAAPQVAQVQVPGEQHHIRVVNHQSGPAHIERVVHRAQTQVVDVQKPGRPAARIVQVVKGESPAPSIEFVNAGGQDHHVYHANEGTGYSSGAAYAPAAAYGTSYGTSYGTTYGRSASYAAPASYGSYGYGASYSAPISYGYSGASYGAPVSYGTSYGSSYGSHSGYAPSSYHGNSYGSTAVIAKA